MPILIPPAARRGPSRQPCIWPRTCTGSDARRRRGRLGRRHPAQRPAPPLPHRRRAGALHDAVGRGDVGADQCHHPAPHRRAGGTPVIPHGGAQRGQPVRLPLPRAPLRRPPSPRPTRAGGRGSAHEELSQLLEAAGGRTLALFTSKRATEAAAAALAPELPYTVLLQGDLPKSLLLEKFATDETLPVRHHGLLAGRRHSGPGPVPRDDRQAPVPTSRRSPAAGTARPSRCWCLLTG